MISSANSASLRGTYQNNLLETKDIGKKMGTNISSQGDMSKVEQIKEALESGEYKINIQALSEKIADELL